MISQSYSNGVSDLRAYQARDRRMAIRFPIEMELNFRVGVKSGKWMPGRTINISSSGILILTDTTPICGSKVDVALTWPGKLDGRVPLRLVVQGRVVRAQGGQAAVTFQRFEFRTAGA